MRIYKLNARKLFSSSLVTRARTPLFSSSNLSFQCLRSFDSDRSCGCFKNTHLLPSKPTCIFYCSTTSRHFTTTSTTDEKSPDDAVDNVDVEPIESWEEEDEAEPEIGDGGDGGGIVLQNCSWGEQALSIANELLQGFGTDVMLYAFKTSPRGYIYVRIDKLSNEYGCPTMEEIEHFSSLYKKKLDEAGARGELPDDLALEVSSPGAERLLKVPDDLQRFKDMPMLVSYITDSDTKSSAKNGIFFVESIDTESGSCTWRLADVKENRDPSTKGRPLTRKQKDWRLRLPYAVCKKVTLYLDY